MFVKKNRGFSLLELLIVVLIIAILVAVAIPYFADYKLRSQRTKAKQDIDMLINAISLFELEEGTSLWQYAKIQDGAAGFTADERTILGLLVGPYIKKLPGDPWGNSYIVDVECGYVCSKGKNGIELQTDVLYDQDVKIFYTSSALTIRSAKYLDVNADGVVAGDKLYVQFTQVINFNSDAVELSGDIAGAINYDTYDLAGVTTDDDNAAGTPDAAIATHFAWLTFRKADGTAATAPTANSFSVISSYLDNGVACALNTPVLVFTLANHADATALATDIKGGAFVNLTATATAGAQALIPCDVSVGTAAVAAAAYGVPVAIEN